jgi:hypothetical protein
MVFYVSATMESVVLVFSENTKIFVISVPTLPFNSADKLEVRTEAMTEHKMTQLTCHCVLLHLLNTHTWTKNS